MSNKNLISSVALFSELYNSSSKKDMFDIIGDFILGICQMDKNYTFTSNELRNQMISSYAFDIPEAVLNTVLNKKLKDKASKSGKSYYINVENIDQSIDLTEKYKNISSEQEKIFDKLIEFIENKNERTISEDEKEKIKDSFYEFLLDNSNSDDYSNYISAFIVKNDSTTGFNDSLAAIKEGLILYDGIRYTPDLNELGNWKNKLTIYLSTEYLFNSQGLNGEIFQEIFNDFFNLVREINQKSKGKEKIIELKYFTETKNEIDRYFNIAESIKSGKIRLNISKPAMAFIVKKAKDISDIALEKVNFFQKLKSLGIYEDDYECSMNDLSKYNLEDKSILEELEKKSEEQGRFFDEKDTLELIRIFTKINSLRKGESKLNFERIGYIYITETSYARYLGHSSLLKMGENDFSYCKEMDFLTTKFWFHLNKGFSKTQNLPKSFDLINKAKIILSSHLVNSVSNKYDEFLEKVKNKELDEAQIEAFNYELKSKVVNPENIDIETVDNSLDFLEDENYLNNYYDQLVSKDVKLSEQEKELNIYRQREEEERLKNEKKLFDDRKQKWAVEKFNEERKLQNNNSIYFLKSLIPDFFIIVITTILFRLEGVTEYLKKLSLDKVTIFWVFILVVLLIQQFIKAYFIDKERVKNNWKDLINIFHFNTKEYKNSRINYFESIYKED